MKLRKTMWAEMKPNFYAGENCDEHRAQWETYSDEGKGGADTCILITLDPAHFPPGTKVEISEPECPHCEMCPGPKDGGGWYCCDAMDWHKFAADEYS